jgi:peptidoglycan/LPS O-acetylase OafA/YrhL
MNRSKIANHLHALDGLRGVLALAVVAAHIGVFTGAENIRGGDTVAALALASVAGFFIVSGLVLTRSYDGRYVVFLARRFVRLWPVYAVTLLVGYAIIGRVPVWSELLWYPWMPHFPADPMALPNPPAWSLCIEAWAMLAMPLWAWFGGAAWRSLLILPTWAGLTLIDGHFVSALFFMAGASMARLEPRSTFLERAALQWLGKVSYSLYLSHWLVLRIAVDAVGPWGLLLAIPGCFLVAWGVWWAVERPSIALSRRIGRADRQTDRSRKASDFMTASN